MTLKSSYPSFSIRIAGTRRTLVQTRKLLLRSQRASRVVPFKSSSAKPKSPSGGS